VRSSLLLPVIGLAATFGACASGPEPTSKKPAAPAATVDVCAGESKPPWRSYDGPLAGVRCEQEQFSRMATIADHLNVDCTFCHIPKDGSGKDFDFPIMTENKETALWMHRTFFGGLKRKDGKPTECRNCHVDKAGKPSAKFLGTPRDVPFAVEWMTTRLTNDFVNLDGSKLKCKSCHEGTWGTPAFQTKVIRKDLSFAPKPPAPAPAEPAPSVEPPAAPSGSAAPIPPIPSGTPRE
jgi:hypothetical protein